MALKMRPTGLGPASTRRTSITACSAASDVSAASMRPAPAPNSCAGIGRYTSSQEPYAPITAWRRWTGPRQSSRQAGNSGRRGRRWKRWNEGSRPSLPGAARTTTGDFGIRSAWDGVISIRQEAQVQEPTPRLKLTKKPQKQSLWKWLRSTSGIEKTPQRAGFKEGSRPSLVDCNYQRTPFEVEIKELLCPISCTHAAVPSEIRRF